MLGLSPWRRKTEAYKLCRALLRCPESIYLRYSLGWGVGLGLSCAYEECAHAWAYEECAYEECALCSCYEERMKRVLLRGSCGRPGAGIKRNGARGLHARSLQRHHAQPSLFGMCVAIPIVAGGSVTSGQFCRRRGRSVWAHSAQRMAASPRTGARAIRPGGVRSCTVRVVGTHPADPGRAGPAAPADARTVHGLRGLYRFVSLLIWDHTP